MTHSTPLAAVRSRLGEAVYNLLRRNGYSTVEQVRATPDAKLVRVGDLNHATLATIRAATATPLRVGTGERRLNTQQLQELEELLTALAAHATSAADAPMRERAVRFAHQLQQQESTR